MTLRAPFARALGRALLISSLATPLAVMAQTSGQEETPEQIWYQFDVMIFSQDSQSATKEKTPAVTEHAKPQSALRLQTVEQILEARKQTKLAELAENQQSGLSEPIVDPSVASIPEATVTALDTASAASTTPKAQAKPMPAVELPAPDPERDPFILLPADQSLLSKEMKTLKRARNYIPLWSGSWRMPLTREGDVVSVLVEGGRSLAVGKDSRSYELEGTLEFSLRRFLHINTELWISTLDPELVAQELAALELARSQPIKPQPLIMDPVTGQMIPAPVSTEATESLVLSVNAEQPLDTESVAIVEEPKPAFLTNRPFNASQRVQLNKLIYIDNPDAGILIKVTPWTPAPPVEAVAAEPQSAEGISGETRVNALQTQSALPVQSPSTVP